MELLYDLSKEVVELLTKKNKTVFTAESCTGGLVTGYLTQVSGSSQVVLGGVCCYSNQIKHSLLNVQTETITNYGAVSFECVIEMVKGALKISQGDYALAVTGIAGPEGGTLEKPVGTVYTAILTKDGGWAQKFLFQGSRDQIRINSVEMIFRLLLATELEKDFFDLQLCDAREI